MIESLTIFEICEGCFWFDKTYLSCDAKKEAYRDYITKCCKFFDREVVK